MRWVLALFFISVVAVSGCISSAGSVCIKGKCFSVEIADTQAGRETGLMNRQHMDPGSGMLFVFENEDVYSFWMKDTLIPLDMVWMDKGGRIVYIERDVQPCEADPCPVYTPPSAALYVLEVNAGISDDYGFAVGDTATFSY